MRRLLLTVLLVLALPGTASAASVKVAACVPAVEQGHRSATFEARMRAARGSERMQVRFTLQVREEGLSRWRRVVADGFDSWLTSLPRVRRYSYARTVTNLAAPAAYRVVVRFRWLGAGGEAVKTARVTSAACRQPDMRPDLAALRIDVLPGPDAATRRYAVTVRNQGRSDADPFVAALRVGGEELDPYPVVGLKAGSQRVVTLTGPACTSGAALTAALDPGEAVDERDEADNVFSALCPAV
jgi:hypothetical protein